MSWQVKLIAFAIAFTMLGLVFELVRKRQLREEYSVLWFLTGTVLIGLIGSYDLLVLITQALGSVYPTSIFFFFALVFLMALSLHYAVQVSRLSNQVKNLAQKLALVENEQRERSHALARQLMGGER